MFSYLEEDMVEANPIFISEVIHHIGREKQGN